MISIGWEGNGTGMGAAGAAAAQLGVEGAPGGLPVVPVARAGTSGSGADSRNRGVRVVTTEWPQGVRVVVTESGRACQRVPRRVPVV